MATIYIEGKPYEVDPEDNLLYAGLSLGFDIPYFCWHPAMGSVGACRQCAVKVYNDEMETSGKIVMACMTPAAEGTRLSIKDREAADFRASVIEWLMINHPHDCPICDEGGECHLQDMTLMTGHAYRRHRFNKRTYRNQYLGPFINHEMNRCIQCYRCVRYYQDLAGGRDLDVFGAHDNVYFGRHQDGVLQSEFSGNLVEVCPTGVFTDKTLKKNYTRKWDLQTAPSVCVHCGVGCNIIPGERYGMLRRVYNRYNHEVNGYFICDRGRYGYEFVNHEKRIYQPLVKRPSGDTEEIGREDALQHIAHLLSNSVGVIGIGSPRASLEANFALHQLVGPERFIAGYSPQEHSLISTALRILQEGPARSPSLHDVQRADAVLILGEDLTNTAPMMAFAVRQAVRNQPMEIPRKLGIPLWNDYAVRDAIQDIRGPLVIATPASTKLDDIATETNHGPPDDLARLGFAIAHELDSEAPKIHGLPEELYELVRNTARALKEAERPLVISGTSSGSEALLQSAANVAWALNSNGKRAHLGLTMPECNSLGLALLGGADIQRALELLQEGQADTLILLENDLYNRLDAQLADSLFEAAKNLIVIDHIHTPTTGRADVVLPAATFAEGDGTQVNHEGRAQRYFQVFVQERGKVQESWRWIRDMMATLGQEMAFGWQNLDGITAAMVEKMPIFAPVSDIAIPESFRLVQQKIPRKPHRYSGRTAMTAHISVHEPKPPDDPDAPFTFSMEGFKGLLPGSITPRYWAPGWNSVQALNKFQSEVGGALTGGDPGRRLIEPKENTKIAYFMGVPEAHQPREGEWLVAPLYHIFGSDELSVLAPGISELMPSPYIAINPDDAMELGVSEGDTLTINAGNVTLKLPTKFLPSLPQGLAGLPWGLPGANRFTTPMWVRANRASD